MQGKMESISTVTGNWIKTKVNPDFLRMVSKILEIKLGFSKPSVNLFHIRHLRRNNHLT